MSEAVVNTTPSQFTIFKGKSAMRMQLQRPLRPEDKFQTGCVFLQAAPLKEVKGETRIYNWEQKKISCKLGVNDLTEIVYRLRAGEDVNLFHSYDGSSKTITLTRNAERGGYFLKVVHKNGTASDEVSVPISSQESYAMLLMLETALPLVHNWV